MSKMFFNNTTSCSNSKLSWKIIEWIAFIGLLFVSGFFVKKVLHEYSTKATSIKTYFEEQRKLDLPVIVMCFNPPINSLVRKKYNATVYDIVGLTDFISNTTIYEEGIYKMERDFNITFDGIGKHKNIEITEMYTLLSATCYRIKPHQKKKVRMSFNLNVIMKEDLEFIPNVSFYFTSDQNSYNVISEDLKGNILFLNTKGSGFYTVMLQKSEYKKLHEVSNCNQENIIPMECISKRLVKILSL